MDVDAGKPGMEALLRTLEGNEEVARQLANLFLDSYPDLSAALVKAVEAEDLLLVRRVVHSIRGTCAIFAAESCIHLARKIENGLLEGSSQTWVEDCADLNASMAEVAGALQLYLARGAAAPRFAFR